MDKILADDISRSTTCGGCGCLKPPGESLCHNCDGQGITLTSEAWEPVWRCPACGHDRGPGVNVSCGNY